MGLTAILAILLAYIIGATPFGFLAGKIIKGVDVRDHGSGNIGATNVFRVIGKPAGIAVFVLDFLKGFLPVYLIHNAAEIGFMAGVGEDFPRWLGILAALATILGHNFTFWLGFKGGKGIATSAGAITALMPGAVGIALVTWIILMVATRYVAVASIGSAIAIPIAIAVMQLRSGGIYWPMMAFGIAVASLAIVRHRSNIGRLRAGTEHRMGTPKTTT